MMWIKRSPYDRTALWVEDPAVPPRITDEATGQHILGATRPAGCPISEWGPHCYRGFVSDERFGSGTVIKRTNRATTRKWRKAGGVQ